MIKTIRENKIFFIVVLLIAILFSIDSIIYLNDYKNLLTIAEETRNAGYEISDPMKLDIFTKLDDYYRNGISVIIQFIFPLLLIVIGCFHFHKKLQTGFFKNIIIRENYKKYINKEIFKSWYASLLIPSFMVVGFLFAMFVTDFNFSLEHYNSYSMIDNNAIPDMSTIIYDLIARILNLTIVSIFCINIGLLFAKKNNNFIIMSVLSYLCIVVYQVAVAIIIGPALSSIFNDYFFANGLTLFNFWYYDAGVTPLKMFIYATLLVVISTILVKRSYHNKENVIINAEK